MYWYLRTIKDSPASIMTDVKNLDFDGKLDGIPKEEALKLAKQIVAWESALGKNLYIPNQKEFWYLIQPHRIKGISGGNRSGKYISKIQACKAVFHR